MVGFTISRHEAVQLTSGVDEAGPYHSGDPDGELDEKLLSGCALGIADVDDIEKTTMDNIAIFRFAFRLWSIPVSELTDTFIASAFNHSA